MSSISIHALSLFVHELAGCMNSQQQSYAHCVAMLLIYHFVDLVDLFENDELDLMPSCIYLFCFHLFQILLRGANGDELKKVKDVVQYGVFAAYHLALETSFLADEGASLPEFPLKSPITVALPEKPSSIERSISTVPGFTIPANEKPQGLHTSSEPQISNSVPIAYSDSTISSSSIDQVERQPLTDGHSSQSTALNLSDSGINSAAFLSTVPSRVKDISDSYCTYEQKIKMGSGGSAVAEITPVNNKVTVMGDHLTVNGFEHSEGIISNNSPDHLGEVVPTLSHSSEVSSSQQDNKSNLEEPGLLKEEFPPSPSDHQSILVSLSSRCVWKGTVCERSHLFRIKYYGSFDKPLGRFLRDHLFDNVSSFFRLCFYLYL